MWGLIIPAVAGLAGSLINSRSNNKAAEYQSRAAEEALKFEREREARRIQEYERREMAKAEYMRQWNIARQGLLKRWGVPMGGASLGTMGTAGAASARTNPVTQERVRMAPMVQPSAKPTLMNMDGWHDWRNPLG